MEDVLRDVGYAVIPCNWLQIMENSVVRERVDNDMRAWEKTEDK